MTSNSIVVKALIGPVKKTYALGTAKPVLKDGQVFVGGQKLRISRSMADKEGWERLEAWIAAAGKR